MSKKPMHKNVKFGLFVGALVLVFSTTLSGIQLLTADKVAQNQDVYANRGYLEVLGISSYNKKVEYTGDKLTTKVIEAGVSKKTEFLNDNVALGTVYDVTIRGYNAGLTLQVGYKDTYYTGVKVVSSNETPSYGGVYLEKLNDFIKGKPFGTQIVIDDGNYAGATITRSAIVDLLRVLTNDFQGAPVEEDFDSEPTSLEHLNAVLDTTSGVNFELLRRTTFLKENGVILKYEVFDNAANSLGITYEGQLKGYKDGLHFLVGIHDNKFTGIHVIESNETPSYGGELITNAHNYIKGKEVVEDILFGFDETGVTITKTALIKVVHAAIKDYLGQELDVPVASLAQLQTALGIDNAVSFRNLYVNKELRAVNVINKYEVSNLDGVVGIVYEANTKGFKDGLHILLGISEDKYAGFVVIDSHESDGWGKDLVDFIEDNIAGVEVTQNILLTPPFQAQTAGVTVTTTALNKLFNAISAEYMEGRE